MEEVAWAKINLALHVRSREADGYHRIETIFAFAEDGDRLRAELGDGLVLRVEGPFANEVGASGDNLVLRAAEALARQGARRSGASLILDKRLPVAAGIGGGSADAAAALRLLVRWWDLDLPRADLLDIARGLGADVAACLASRTARGLGRGDELVSQDGSGLGGTPLLLVNPGVPLATGRIFSGWDGVDGGPLPAASPLAAALDARNDLEPAAIALAPEIATLLGMLSDAPGAILARMTGSGATCFALFESESSRDGAASAVAAARPQWWQLASRLR